MGLQYKLKRGFILKPIGNGKFKSYYFPIYANSQVYFTEIQPFCWVSNFQTYPILQFS